METLTSNSTSTSTTKKATGETGLGFSKRDENIKSEEEKGELEFSVITNDG